MVLQQIKEGTFKVVSLGNTGLQILAKDLPEKFAVIVNGLQKQQLKFDYTLSKQRNSDDDFSWKKIKDGNKPNWKSAGNYTMPDLDGHIWQVKASGEEEARLKVNNVLG